MKIQKILANITKVCHTLTIEAKEAIVNLKKQTAKEDETELTEENIDELLDKLEAQLTGSDQEDDKIVFSILSDQSHCLCSPPGDGQ